MTGSRLILTLAVGAIAVIAVVWFISSFFVLEDESPRGSLASPTVAVVDGMRSVEPG